MKFELKTENDRFSKTIFSFTIVVLIFSLIFLMSSITFKLGNISRHFEINYLCNVLKIDKSSSNFKKLSKLLKETNKFKIWDLCLEIVK